MFYYLMNLPQIKPRVDEGMRLKGASESEALSSINMQKMSTSTHQSGSWRGEKILFAIQDTWDANKEVSGLQIG